jgi:transcriptional regulator with XRE-family HTH domain
MNNLNPTNEALGRALGVSHASISRYRSADRTPSDEVVLKISNLMGWPVEEQLRAKVDQEAGRGTPYADGFKQRLQVAILALDVEDEPADG